MTNKVLYLYSIIVFCVHKRHRQEMINTNTDISESQNQNQNQKNDSNWDKDVQEGIINNQQIKVDIYEECVNRYFAYNEYLTNSNHTIYISNSSSAGLKDLEYEISHSSCTGLRLRNKNQILKSKKKAFLQSKSKSKNKSKNKGLIQNVFNKVFRPTILVRNERHDKTHSNNFTKSTNTEAKVSNFNPFFSNTHKANPNMNNIYTDNKENIKTHNINANINSFLCSYTFNKYFHQKKKRFIQKRLRDNTNTLQQNFIENYAHIKEYMNTTYTDLSQNSLNALDEFYNNLVEKENEMISQGCINNQTSNEFRYNMHSVSEKKMCLDLAKIIPFKLVSCLTGVNTKSIIRWSEVGIERKKGGGRKTLDPELEEKLYEWYLQMRNKGETLTNNIIIKKALKLSKIPGFKASKGWLGKFKNKYNITVRGRKVKYLF